MSLGRANNKVFSGCRTAVRWTSVLRYWGYFFIKSVKPLHGALFAPVPVWIQMYSFQSENDLEIEQKFKNRVTAPSKKDWLNVPWAVKTRRNVITRSRSTQALWISDQTERRISNWGLNHKFTNVQESGPAFWRRRRTCRHTILAVVPANGMVKNSDGERFRGFSAVNEQNFRHWKPTENMANDLPIVQKPWFDVICSR